MTFTLKCPICKKITFDHFVYHFSVITCSENCATQVQQKYVAGKDLPPLELPIPTCEWCRIEIRDIPELYNNVFFCSEYCLNFYKEEQGIKSF